MIKKIAVILLSFCVGVLFILSAYFKLWPIEPFEYKIVGTTFIGWQYSVFVARIIIAVEFALGVLLICSYRLKSTLKITIVLLAVFSIHLLYLIISNGNTADCGCMGSLMELTPLQGLLKNTGLIVICLLLYRWRFDFELRIPMIKKFITFIVMLISLVSVFIVNPVDFKNSRNYLNRPFETFEMDLDTVYNSTPSDVVEQPQIDIRQKKYVLAFFSSSCPHCKTAAQKLSVISFRNPDIPIYIFMNGDTAKVRNFLKQTETSHIPHSRLGRAFFIPLAGVDLPVIYYYNKGKIDKKVDYFTLEQYHIEEWLGE